jgi:hypothetical protein
MADNFLGKSFPQGKSDWNLLAYNTAVPQKLVKPTQGLYATCLNRDHAKRVWSVDESFPWLEDLTSAGSAVDRANISTLSELLAVAVHRLITVVQFSSFLPTYVKQAWTCQIKALTIEHWQASLAILEELYFDHRCAQQDYHPGYDGLQATVSQNQEFTAEMVFIEQELNTIAMILQYAEISDPPTPA